MSLRGWSLALMLAVLAFFLVGCLEHEDQLCEYKYKKVKGRTVEVVDCD